MGASRCCSTATGPSEWPGNARSAVAPQPRAAPARSTGPRSSSAPKASTSRCTRRSPTEAPCASLAPAGTSTARRDRRAAALLGCVEGPRHFPRLDGELLLRLRLGCTFEPELELLEPPIRVRVARLRVAEVLPDDVEIVAEAGEVPAELRHVGHDLARVLLDLHALEAEHEHEQVGVQRRR